MPRVDLRLAFAAAATDGLKAQKIFTNRSSEARAFERALKAVHTPTVAPGARSPVEDLAAGRRNVLVFYGIGGIGKTELSRELEERFAAAQDRQHEHPIPIRLDFADTSALDLESCMLRLRAGFADLGPSWPAFDLAFSIYWERAHPTQPLHEFISHNSLLHRSRHAADLAAEVAAAVASVFTGGIGGAVAAAGKFSGHVYAEVRKARQERHLLAECPLFGELIDAEPTLETLSYLPYLLAWELDRRHTQSSIVVFLDTFEVVSGRSTRELEASVQRMVFLMPNVLFVVTGRNRLDWDMPSSSGELSYRGGEYWPGLSRDNVTDEPRQHLVGYLTPVDAEKFLTQAVTRDGAPAIGPPLRARIVTGSGGWPLYLDLSVAHFLEMSSHGRIPAEQDFGGPLASVVLRTLRDLARDQRNLLRAASLLHTFDERFLRAALPQISDAELDRFLERPFVDDEPQRVWRYSLHERLREQVLESDSSLSDGWSPRERTETAERVAAWLSGMVLPAVREHDRALVIGLIAAGTVLSAYLRQFPEWLVEAAAYAGEAGLWSALPDYVGATAVSPELAFVRGLQGVRRWGEGSLNEALPIISEALRDAGIPKSGRDLLLLHQAHATRYAGKYRQAAGLYRALLEPECRFASEARYWLADYTYLRGNFEQALADLAACEPHSGYLRVDWLCTRGHIYRVNGLFDRAVADYRQAAGEADRLHSLAQKSKAATHEVEAVCWVSPLQALELAREARDLALEAGNRFMQVRLLSAVAIAHALLSRPEAADAAIDEARSLSQVTSYRGGAVFASVASALVGHLTDQQRLSREMAVIDAMTREMGGNRFWLGIIGAWTGSREQPGPQYTWLDGPVAMATRWSAVANARV